MTQTSTRGWTYAGLAISLLGIPAIVTAQRLLAPDPTAASSIVIREIAILAVTAFVLWIVVARERLPLSSIGLRFDRVGRSVAWGFGLAVAAFVILLACLAGFSDLGIHYGEGSGISRALPVTFLAVMRAGISEEVLYRGFALERLQSLTGSKWIAAGVTLVLFAAFHFRQGMAGVFLAFVLGGLFTAYYLWKRDLLATITGHFLVDFVPNVLLPLLGAGD
ncbi:hypothetical protein GCM10023264_22440 [Sphingomonas daechungensis]|uniref:CPBP family intramembrane metalloprotease n=1 Tax=Sphingomonas daechungensis TaxID=1176646 RepID=A0ABX6T7N9_9SPHN|nr:type II CAAX endopeptidase family protein [Sphingomonas daechungensis]QNP43683.1 CPBP family intramembrane metalloprotease [Sphingomonas daechungensis]